MRLSANLLLQKRKSEWKPKTGGRKGYIFRQKKKKTQKGKKEHKGNRLTKRQDLPAENRN